MDEQLRTGLDFERGGHTRHERHALRNRFELDAHGNALRQATMDISA